MRRSRQGPPDAVINDAKKPRPDNPFKIVVTPKPKENRILRGYLIELTEKLASEAKSGVLKGLGGFADYGNSYMLGLEGSYLEEPESAVLPIKRLERRVMDQIEQEE